MQSHHEVDFGPWHGDRDIFGKPWTGGNVPSGYTACAFGDFAQTCNTNTAKYPGRSTVAYGLGDRFVYKYNVTGTIPCSLREFGIDPYPGQNKVCFVQPSGPDGYIYCTAGFDGNCPVGAETTAAYGLNGYGWTYHKFSAGFNCNATTFGASSDVLGGHAMCFTAGPGGGAEFCARLNETCFVSAKSTVYYGADGRFVSKAGVTGSIVCDKPHFGSDPLFGIVKSCFAKKE